MDNNELNTKIENTLNSIDSLKTAEANPFLYSKIMNRIKEAEQPSVKFSHSYVWKLAVVFLFLITVNFLVLISYSGKYKESKTDSFTTFLNEYSIINQTYNY
jgi:hypothetical protein